MRITLTAGQDVRRCFFARGKSAEASGQCPSCGAKPYLVAGKVCRPSADDRAYESDAACCACGAPAGVLRVESATLFGVREDAAVLEHGRMRVYDGRPRVYGGDKP